MTQPELTVVGSFAVGLTLRADRFPVKGETLLGRDFDQGPGGKGSNQAVQIARLGGRVEFAGLIGQDSLGEMALALYAQEQVGTAYLERTPERNTGVGFIVLDARGDNFIVLDPGANGLLSPAHVDRLLPRLRESRVVVTQLEIPAETAARAMTLGRQAGVITVLNPAPAAPFPPAAFAHVDYVTPNQTELRVLLGRRPDDPTDSRDLCGELLRAGVGTVILTRGGEGALVVNGQGALEVPALQVEVVDTTGAGDAFSGALAVSLAEGRGLAESVRRAAAAGAMACTRLGVIPALPYRADVEKLLGG